LISLKSAPTGSLPKSSWPSLHPVPITIKLVSFYQSFSGDMMKEKKLK
jgi:hypothetical protein